MKTVLVTGGAGFIGSNFIRYMLDKHPDYRIINIDLLTYAGNLGNLSGVENNENYIFYRVDIRDRYAVENIFAFYDIDYVVNFAAESHVDRSIIEPDVFLTTNIIGTQVLLDAAKNKWKLLPGDKYDTSYKEGVRFHQVSTDEVYGSLEGQGKFTEDMPIMPNSPYSASKAAADLIVRAYRQTYGMPVTVSRCSNNYGPYQFPEKFIPLLILNCISDRQLPIYGDGMQIRDWIHVSDHCEAVDSILHCGENGEIYNIGGGNELTNLDVAKLIADMFGKTHDIIKFVKDRPGHDRRYALDCTKIETQLGFSPKHSFESGIEECVLWYLNNMEWVKKAVSGDYLKYYEAMYG